MGTLPPILIGVGAAAVVAFLARAALRGRGGRAGGAGGGGRDGARRTREVAIALTGAGLAVASVVAGLSVLRVDEPPVGELFAAGPGIATGLGPAPGRGMVAGLGVRFTGCDRPLEGTLVFAGTAEFFEDHAVALARPRHVTVAVPGTEGVEIDSVGLGGGYYDALAPNTAAADGGESSASPLEHEPPVRRLAVTSVDAVVRGWSSSLSPIVVRFTADWVERRGLGTCYLKLPPLVGTATVIGAQDGRGRGVPTRDELPNGDETHSNDGSVWVPYRRAMAIGSAVAVVDAGRHEVIDADRAPNAVAGSLPAYACSGGDPSTGELGDRDVDLAGPGIDGGYAVRGAAFGRLARELDCGGIVTIAEAGSATKRDLVLLLVGAAFSLGIAMVLEVLLDVHRRRAAARS
jgi:hypothetical protein